MKKKFKFLTVLFSSIILALTSLNPLSKGREFESVRNEYSQVIREVDRLSSKYLNYPSNNKLVKAKNDKVIYNEEYLKKTINEIYSSFNQKEKESLLDIKNANSDFNLGYFLITSNKINDYSEYEKDISRLNNKIINVNSRIKCLIASIPVAVASTLATITSMVSGISISSLIPIVGWTVAASLTLGLTVYIICNWNTIRDYFSSYWNNIREKFNGISSILDDVTSNVEDEVKEIPIVEVKTEDVTSIEKIVTLTEIKIITTVTTYTVTTTTIDGKTTTTSVPTSKTSSVKIVDKSIGGILKRKKYKDILDKNKVSVEEALKLLSKYLSVSLSKFYDDKKKILCIGRDTSAYKKINKNGFKRFGNSQIYNTYADIYGFFSFYHKDYSQDVKKYGYEILDLINEALVVYCCENDWTFICVTHPYMYIHCKSEAELKTANQGGSGYYKELKILRTYGYNLLKSKTGILTGDYMYHTWETLPHPTWRGVDAWWQPTDYVTTRSTLNKFTVTSPTKNIPVIQDRWLKQNI